MPKFKINWLTVAGVGLTGAAFVVARLQQKQDIDQAVAQQINALFETTLEVK